MSGRHRLPTVPSTGTRRVAAASVVGLTGLAAAFAAPQSAFADQTTPADTPASSAPSTAPSSDVPTSDAPSSSAPTSDAPSSSAPTSDAPSSDVPPSTAPSSDVPTSSAPSSDAPSPSVAAPSAPVRTGAVRTAPVLRAPVRSAITPNLGLRKAPSGAALRVDIAAGAAVPAGTTTVGSVLQIVTTPAGGTPVTTECTTTAGTGLPAGSSQCPSVEATDATITVTQLSAPANLVADPAPQSLQTCTPDDVCFLDGLLVLTDKGTPPVAHGDTITVPENTTDVLDVLANDDPGAAGTATVTAVTQPQHGTAVVVPTPAPPAPPVVLDGVRRAAAAPPASYVRYTPNPGYVGPDPFTYTASTANGTSTATVTLTVAGPPLARPDTATTAHGKAVVIHVVDNDSANFGGALTLASVTTPAHGTARIAGGSIVYTPDASFAGTETFDYTVTTPLGRATGTVTVRVAAPPPPAQPASHDTAPLAATGVPAEALLDGGLALLAAGTVSTALGRRRRGRRAL